VTGRQLRLTDRPAADATEQPDLRDRQPSWPQPWDHAASVL